MVWRVATYCWLQTCVLEFVGSWSIYEDYGNNKQ